MKVCCLDIETTGLDFDKSEITELAFVIKEWGEKKPLVIAHSYCSITGVITPEIEELTGITEKLLKQTGRDVTTAVGELALSLYRHGVSYIVAQNGRGFDKIFLEKVSPESIISATPWLDTKEDVEWPKSFKSNSLKFLAAELGFLNPFPHDALSDVMTTLRVLEVAEKEGITSLDRMIALSAVPYVNVVSTASFDQKEAAKALGFRWESDGDFRVPKTWVKRVRENKLEELSEAVRNAGFTIRRI